MIFDVPTKEQYRDLLDNYPFDESILKEETFNYTVHPEGSIDRMFANNQIQTWHVHLLNRIYQTRWSWVYLNHLFNKGIPDNEWYISPGSKGQSVEYFPHFEKSHHITKAQFDYFSDVFYYKLFSAWDNLGHLLNNMYNLKIDRADFYKAVKALKDVRPDLYNELNDLMESDEFQKMRGFRHSSTHNELAGHVGSGMSRFSDSTATGITFGTGNYTPSSQIKANADESLELFTRAVSAIDNQVRIDKS